MEGAPPIKKKSELTTIMPNTKTQAAPASQENSEENTENKEEKTQSTKEDAGESSDDAGKDPKKKGKDPYENQKIRAENAERERDEALKAKAELEEQLEQKANSQGEVSDEDLEAFAEEHDVSVDFVKGLSEKLSAKVSKEAEKLVSDKLSAKEKEQQKAQILNDFKRDFDKIGEDWEGASLSEQAVRMHYLAAKAKDSNHSVADSVEEIYGSFKQGKPSAEDDPRGADQVGESIDFASLSKDPEKLEKVIKDPKARAKYYSWRDKQGL